MGGRGLGAAGELRESLYLCRCGQLQWSSCVGEEGGRGGRERREGEGVGGGREKLTDRESNRSKCGNGEEQRKVEGSWGEWGRGESGGE